jgi:glycosyltransferase involved in cell wall biosynthesis
VEQVTGAVGLLVPPGNAEALALALRELSSDDGRLESLGRNARKLVEAEHSVEMHVSRLIKLFEDVGVCVG